MENERAEWSGCGQSGEDKFLFSFYYFFFVCRNMSLMSETEQAEQIWGEWGRCGQNSVDNS